MADHSLMIPAEFEAMSEEDKKRYERLCYQCYTLLGGSSIEVDLEDPDYVMAFDKAVSVYRTMSSGSVVLQYGFLQLEPTQSVYTLNDRIDNVIRIWRGRGIFGGPTSALGSFESFGAATANSLLRGAVSPNAGSTDLVSYDFLLQYEETLSRLFAREIHFVWKNETKQLLLTQTPRRDETLLLHVAVLKSMGELLRDHFAQDWIQKYTLATLKGILGEKYSLFATMPGAQGGTVMKGDALKQAANEEKQLLEQDLTLYSDSGGIPMPVRG